MLLVFFVLFWLQTETYAHLTERPDAIDRFCALYADCEANKQQAPQAAIDLALVQILTDLHLFFHGMSPLTTKKLRDFDGFDQMANYSAANSNRIVLNHTQRMQRLSTLYSAIPVSFIKAKAAFAMGLNAQETGHHQQAERLFFEAVYMLDLVSPTGRPTAPLISELGANCLKAYGDLLLYNYKYKYAIAAYQSCSASYQLRRRNKDYYYLLKDMAATAFKNDDVKRAIPFYREVLQICIAEKKTTEVYHWHAFAPAH
jgi:tetratricopeptide (TPR) repeat protein